MNIHNLYFGYLTKMENKVKQFYRTATELFESADCKLLITEDKFVEISEGKRLDRISLDWECKCGRKQKSSIGCFKQYKRCRACGIQMSKGNITYDTFKDVLEKEGWKLIDPKEKYLNTKTLMVVETDNGELVTTSYNRFSQGHRSKSAAIDAQRHTQTFVEEKFKERGFSLKDEYTNKSTPLLYTCKCGKNAYISYENLIKNKVGCMACANREKHLNPAVEKEELKKKMLEKFGNEYYINSDVHKGKMKEKYGVEFAMKNPEVLAKSQKNSFRTKPYIFPSGKKVDVQGYEPLCIDYLLYEEHIDEKNIVVGTGNVPAIDYMYDKERLYFPDIYIPKLNKIIEERIYKPHLNFLCPHKKFSGVSDLDYHIR